MSSMEKDSPEAPRPQRIPYWRILTDQGVCTPEVIDFPYHGAGTEDKPYVVEWIPNDPLSLSSSAYAGGINEVLTGLDIGEEVATLGVSLFVMGFAVGPLLWAPMSEPYGRQIVFLFTFFSLSAFCAGAAGAQHAYALIILRFFAGSFGSSPLTNAGGVIADIFPAEKRGLATSLFAGAPFLGPTLGPVIGGFLGENAGWRWVQGFLAVFTGIIWMCQSLLVPETYAPVLLRKRAERLSKITGKVYRSKLDIDRGKVSARNAFGTALKRPWILLFSEPIVFSLLYMAIVYGTLWHALRRIPNHLPRD
ncbi:hypothetical protein N7454_011010 [Penicillium verhagenii]|nr:hypothetical protein N7454_011010 [Penicillium verhagenii]